MAAKEEETLNQIKTKISNITQVVSDKTKNHREMVGELEFTKGEIRNL